MSDTPETEKAWIPKKGETNLLWHKRQHATSKKLERELNQAIAKEQSTAELCKRMIELSERLQQERDGLHNALVTIAPFVMDDYFPNCATPEYKAAVEKMQSTLEKLKEPKTNNVLETP